MNNYYALIRGGWVANMVSDPSDEFLENLKEDFDFVVPVPEGIESVIGWEYDGKEFIQPSFGEQL